LFYIAAGGNAVASGFVICREADIAFIFRQVFKIISGIVITDTYNMIKVGNSCCPVAEIFNLRIAAACYGSNSMAHRG